MDGRIGYSEETRVEVARQFALGNGPRAVATYLGLPHGTMRTWQDAYRQDGQPGLVPRPRGRKPSVVGKESLEQKAYRLEMENALLKKFQALMAQDTAAQPSRRKQSRH